MFLGSRADDLAAAVSRLSRQCGILNISQPYSPSWPLTMAAVMSAYADDDNLSA
jgi:hypothetical protein